MKNICLLIYVLFFSCGLFAQDKSKIIEVNILPYKTIANGAFFKSLVIKSDEDALEYLNNFDFQWGYHYKLKVRRIELAKPPADGSSIEYELIKVLSKEKANPLDTFQLLLQGQKYLGPPSDDDTYEMMKPMSDSTYLYDGEIELIVPENFKAKFNEALMPEKWIFGKFVFAENNKIRLIGFR
jgi:hypothetical protein